MSDTEIHLKDISTDALIAETYPKSFSEYTLDDYLQTSVPFEHLSVWRSDKFLFERKLAEMAMCAKKAGVPNFRTLWKAYAEKLTDSPDEEEQHITNFPNQPVEILCGAWICDQRGVRKKGEGSSMIYACSHPIMPIARLVNIDTGIEKVKIAFSRGKNLGAWRTLIVERKIISSANKIVELSDYGISVTSETARNLVNYFQDCEAANSEYNTQYSEQECVTRLGWIDRGNGLEFSPYIKDLAFDGESEYRSKYEDIKQKGDIGKWVDLARDTIRGNSPEARIVFAAGLASTLVKPLGCNNFWVHLWGETESAKTVLAMFPASMWGNPEVGHYISTFDATYVGMEKTAAFYNSMPYIVDELQIVDVKREMDTLVYKLTEGCGRTRGNKQGGIDKISEWRNCIITTGERPINSGRSGGGAVNRVIEIECKMPFFKDPRGVANTLKSNYGILGIMFVKLLGLKGYIRSEVDDECDIEPSEPLAEEIFKGYYDSLVNEHKIMQKQAQAAALILTADHIITKEIFDDGKQLTVEEILPFLKTKSDVSVNRRAHEYLVDYIGVNQSKFLCADNPTSDINSPRITELWGEIEGGYAYIIAPIYDRICLEAGFNGRALLSYLDKNGFLKTNGGRLRLRRRIGNSVLQTVALKLDGDLSDSGEVNPDDYDF